MRRKHSVVGAARRSTRSFLIAVAALALALTGCGDLGEPAKPTVALEGVSTVGPNPFTPAVGADTAVAPPPQAGGTFAGDTVGLFGGTLNEATCDKAQLVAFLQQDNTKAVVWAGVLGTTPAEIPAFVETLTPTILRSDTLVTNHGFANGQATAYTAVLQAGTAVLVDKHGFPVVKCFCGNPLVPAVLPANAVFTGPEWTTFVQNQVTVIAPVEQTVQQFVIVDPNTGTAFERPAGSTGTSDAPTTVPPSPTPVLPAPTSPPVQTPTSPPPATSAPPPTTAPATAASPPPATPPPTTGAAPPPTTAATPPPTTAAPAPPPPPATVSPPATSPASPPAAVPPATPTAPSPSPPATPTTAPPTTQATTPAPTTATPTTATPTTPSPTPTASPSAAVASWLVGDCYVAAGQAHAVVLVRAEGQAHTFTVRVRLGPESTPIAVDTVDVRSTPGQVSQAIVTAPAPSTPDGPIACAIESIVDENGTAPTAGSPLPPPPSTAPTPTMPASPAAPPGQPSPGLPTPAPS